MADTVDKNVEKKDSQPFEEITNNNYEFRGHHFPKRPALDLSFKNVTYTTTSWNKLRRSK